MKIAIICYYHVDATVSLVRYLKKIDSNLEIDFICLFSQSDKNSTPISFSDITVSNGFLSDNEINKIVDKEVLNYLKGIARLKIFLFHTHFIYDLMNYLFLVRLRNHIIHENYDLIHFVGNNRFIIWLNVITRMKAKFHMVHEPFPHTHYSITKRRLFTHKFLMNLLISTGSHITVPSVASYKRCLDNWKFKPNKLSIVPFSQLEIYKEYLKKDIRKSDKTILFYGIINKYKGVDVLLEAMKEVIKVFPDLKLIIAGRGKINYEIADLNNNNYEIINRYISNEEIAELNQLATLVVCPYYSASQSGVVMTSFAFNNPVLATKVGALSEFIEDGKTGILIDYPDANILATKIVDFFRNLDKIDAFRNNISNMYFKGEFSWENITEQYYKLLQSEINEIV